MKSKITDDIKVALKAGDKKRVGVLRLVTAEIKQREVDTRTDLNDDDLVTILEKMLKQRKESIKYFALAQRNDLLEQEEFECEVIANYLPEQMDDDALEKLINQLIMQIQADTMKDMGKVMGMLKSQATERIDMGKASAIIKKRLQ